MVHVRYMDMLTSNLHSYIFYGKKSMAFKLLFTLVEVNTTTVFNLT